jgi:hypothetical protein
VCSGGGIEAGASGDPNGRGLGGPGGTVDMPAIVVARID